MSVVQANRLTKTYRGGARGIRDISFSIEEGEIFGFIGPNGAGKSTTIRTLLQLIHPTSGEAAIFGKPVVKHGKDIRRQIGYVPSEVHYYDDMKVIDLLAYSQRFYGKANKGRVEQLCSRLQLDVHRKIEDLSFGNRKKVGIVQALLHEPKLLILDEPTGGLDPLMQSVFFELMEEENRKGATVFFSSHILSEVQKMCDRVALIKEGSLIQVETIDNLTKNNFKNVTLTLAESAEDAARLLPELPGVIRREANGRELHLLYNGHIRDLLDGIRPLPLVDLRIEEPSLEEIFMHHYKEGGDGR